MSWRHALVLLVLLAGCRDEKALPADVIARVGSRTVTIDDFKRYLERNAGTELAQIVPEAASALLDQHVQEVLLAEFAAQRDIEASAEEVAAAVRGEPGSTATEKRDELRRNTLLAEIAANVPPPTPEQVRAHYQQFIRDFHFDERVRVSQILVQEESLAADLVERHRAGTPFAELAASHSVAPNASRGGDLGWITRNDLPRVFEQQIFDLEPGEITDVIRTDTGFYIFLVSEHRDAGTLDFEAAEPMIRQRLNEENARKQLSNLLIEARKTIPVSILARRLPFDYTGNFPRSAAE